MAGDVIHGASAVPAAEVLADVPRRTLTDLLSPQAAQQWLPQPRTAHCKAAESSLLTGGGSSRVISKDEVAEHNSMETGVWVTHKARRRNHD